MMNSPFAHAARGHSSSPSFTRARSPPDSARDSPPAKKARLDSPVRMDDDENPPEMTEDMFAVMTAAVEAFGDCDEAWEMVGATMRRPRVKPIRWKLEFLAAGGSKIIQAARRGSEPTPAPAPQPSPQPPPRPAPAARPEGVLAISPDDNVPDLNDDEGFDVVPDDDDSDFDELDGHGGAREGEGEGDLFGVAWSHEEQDKLVALCDASRAQHGVVRWSEVVAHMGGRNRRSCENKYHSARKLALERGAMPRGRNSWSEADDALLMAEIKRRPRRTFTEIGKLLKRTGVACQQRALEWRNGRLKRQPPPPRERVVDAASTAEDLASSYQTWTEAERERLFSLYDRPGNADWIEILSALPGRTRGACRDQIKRRNAAIAFAGPAPGPSQRPRRIKWTDEEHRTLFNLYDSLVDSASFVDWDQILPHLPTRQLSACHIQISRRKGDERRPEKVMSVDSTKKGVAFTESWNDYLARTGQAPLNPRPAAPEADTNAVDEPQPQPQPAGAAVVPVVQDEEEEEEEEEDDTDLYLNLMEIVSRYEADGRKLDWPAISGLMATLGTALDPEECKDLYEEIDPFDG